MSELDELIRECLGDVVIISNASRVYPRQWDGFVDYSLVDDSKLSKFLFKGFELGTRKKPERTRVFIGSKEEAIEDFENRFSPLRFLILQGLAGSADMETPRLVLGAEPQKRRVRASLPDGFITLGELVAFLNRHRGELASLRHQDVTVRGQIVGDDPVLVRHSLPID